ncbi:hypothetical protein GCM10009605_33580 [Nocardiopsis composta]
MTSLMQPTRTDRRGGVGDSVARPDGRLKVTGRFAYSSDLWAEGMVWATTLRSPHAAALIRSIDVSRALAAPACTPCSPTRTSPAPRPTA